MALTIKLFGPIQVFVRDQPIQPMRSRKGLWLLALLTLREKAPVEREWLASMLWPDSDRTQAFANLRTNLSELRSALGAEGDRIRTPTRHTVQIDLTGAKVDVIDFDRGVASGKRPELERAVALYVGPLLEGSSEEWASQERGSREQDCLRTLQTLGETALTAGDANAAIGWFQQAAALDPWWDASQRGLMEAYAKVGDINEALLVYRAFEERLRSESAGIPDEQTSTLYAQLRAKARGHLATMATASVEQVSGFVPAPISELVGREDERNDLLVLIRRSRLVTLTGLGGIGKTRLAIAVGMAVEGEFRDGRWFVSLAPLADGEMVPRQVCGVFGLKERPGQTWLEMLTEHLRPRRALLILDNCEHLITASASLARHLLQECPGVRVLATSREAMGVLGESAWSVPTLPVPDPRYLPQTAATMQRVVAGYEGVQLFLERAREVDRSFRLAASNALAIAEICYGLEGVPLAIELAAARVKALSIGQIRSRLGDHLGLLTSGGRSTGPRHQTLRSTLDWSYELLTEVELTLLRRLSVFVGGWTLEAAEEVASEAGIAKETVANVLASLVDKSLVSFVEANAEVGERYRMLETVRQYANEKLRECGEEESTLRRHRVWALGVSERAEAFLRGKDQKIWLSVLGAEHGNLLKALIGFESSPSEGLEGLRMARALTDFWNIRGPMSEGRERLRRALEHEGGIEESPERAQALNRTGALAFHDDDLPAAKSFFEESLAMRQRVDDPAGMVSPMHNLGNVLCREGRFAEAQTAYEKCLSLAKETSQREIYALVLVNLGFLLLSHLAEVRLARERYEEALSTYRELGEPRGISIALEGVGRAAAALGDYERARVSLEESRAMREDINDQGARWMDLHLGAVAYCRGDFASATGHFDRSMDEFREMGNVAGIAATHKFLGHMELWAGNLEKAVSQYEEAADLYRKVGEQRNVIFVLTALGDAKVDQGDLDSARDHLMTGLKLARELGTWKGIAMSLDALASLLVHEGSVLEGVCLWGATETERQRTGERLPFPAEMRSKRDIDRARTALGDEAFESAWKRGASLTLDLAADEAATLDSASTKPRTQVSLG